MNKILTTSLLLASSSVVMAEGSPLLPAPGTSSLNLEAVYQTGDEFYLGSKKIDLGGDLDQTTYWLKLGYGLTDSIALDGRVGYSETDFEGSPTDQRDLADSNIGVTWRLVDEFISEDNLPSLAVRFGATIAGNYSTGAIDSLGDGAHSADLSFLAGRVLNDKIAVSAEVGYRVREGSVPEEIFYSASGYYFLNPVLSFSLSYQVVDSRGDLDIGTPEFTAERFNEVKEDNQRIALGFAYNINHQFSLTGGWANVVDGRNTLLSDTYSLSAGYAF